MDPIAELQQQIQDAYAAGLAHASELAWKDKEKSVDPRLRDYLYYFPALARACKPTSIYWPGPDQELEFFVMGLPDRSRRPTVIVRPDERAPLAVSSRCDVATTAPSAVDFARADASKKAAGVEDAVAACRHGGYVLVTNYHADADVRRAVNEERFPGGKLLIATLFVGIR